MVQKTIVAAVSIVIYLALQSLTEIISKYSTDGKHAVASLKRNSIQKLIVDSFFFSPPKIFSHTSPVQVVSSNEKY